MSLDWMLSDIAPTSNLSDDINTAKSERLGLKHTTENAMKVNRASEILLKLPHADESVHIISDGRFDYFSFVPVIIKLLNDYSVHFYGSTWTMNRDNVLALFDLFDTGKIGSINILTGMYFKSRESAVYATLIDGLQNRGQRYRALKNHAKIMLFNHSDNYIVLEGSANFTANPRIEQTTITNNRDLWAFHKSWMDTILDG